jgi:flagellar protein FlaG
MDLDIQRVVQNLPVQEKRQKEQDNRLPAAEQGSEKQHREVVKNNLLAQLESYSKEDMERYLNKLFGSNLLFNKRLKFSVNRELNQVIVKVIDSSTDEVIKEIPPEELQRVQAKIKEAIGLLIDEII